MQWKENIVMLCLIAYLQFVVFIWPLSPKSLGWLGYKEVTLSNLAKTDTMYHHYKRVYWYSLLLTQNIQVTITDRESFYSFLTNAGPVTYCKLTRSKLNITTIFHTKHLRFSFFFFFWGGGGETAEIRNNSLKAKRKWKGPTQSANFPLHNFMHVMERIYGKLLLQ